jgi:hypothetical protein
MSEKQDGALHAVAMAAEKTAKELRQQPVTDGGIRLGVAAGLERFALNLLADPPPTGD